MLLSTSPAQVLFRGTYSQAGDREQIAFKSGKPVEFVKLMDPDNGNIFDWTLAEHINGEVRPGEVYNFTVEQTSELVANRTQRGGTYTTIKYKHKIVDAKPVTAAAKAA